MKRKYFNALLLGAFAIASMGVVTSCSDYDDEINDLQSQIDNLSSLKATKTDVDAQIASLSSQLEDAKAQATAAQAGTAEEKARAEAAEAALAARLTTLENARTELEALIKDLQDNKVSKSEFNEKVTDIYGQLEAVQTGLASAMTDIETLKNGLNDEATARAAAIADLQQQINALKAIGDPAQLVADLEALKEKVANLGIEDIKSSLQEVQNKIVAALEEIDVLNVLIKTQLRSLVFQPESYYWGIEAQKILTLDYTAWTLPTTDYKTDETTKKHERYTSTNKSKVLDFIAKYHMNPSSADKSSFKAVNVLSDDKAYVRTAAAGLYVKDWNVADGFLNVNIKMNDPSKVKTVADDEAVTVFAAQVNLSTGDKDTTITSDYATLYKQTVKDIVLTHTPKASNIYATGVENTHCGDCSLTDNLNHLMQTAYEAAYDFEPQDTVWYTSNGIDLRKLVETHYTTTDGKHVKLDPATYGMEYKFELTGLFFGGNKTSESAHAAIATDGYTLRPQMPEESTGAQQAYGATQARASIGRTPLVRVSLVDSETGEVYDYGYIRIKIVDKTANPAEDQADKYISYDKEDGVPGYTYYGECTLPAWNYKTTWIQTEYDLYHMLNLTREEFEANYTLELEAATSTEAKQYSFNPTTQKFTAATTKYGTVREQNDASSEDGTLSSVLVWNMTGAQAYDYFTKVKNNPDNDYSVAVKYVSADKTNLPDVYVRFVANNTIVIEPASAVLAWVNSVKNANYWYTENTANAGWDEIHNNVLTPEDNVGGAGDKMVQTFSNVFYGNNIDAASILTITDKTKNNEYNASKLTLDLIFGQKNVGNKFLGNDGKTYTIGVSTSGKELTATYGTTTQTIATISSDADVNKQKVTYNPNSTFACELLNYAAHNALDDNTIKAFVTVKATNECPKPLAFDEECFEVRFLRPINVYNADATIEDANTSSVQTIKLHDMVKFTDWRDSWKPASQGHGDYCTYYGIQEIKVAGVSDGGYISTNADVLTNQGDGTTKSLKNVNSNVDFKYYASKGTSHDGGYLEYKNFSSTVQEFWVSVPVEVTYYWGTIRTTVTINVKKTVSNAKQH